jgi:hypothetical protein
MWITPHGYCIPEMGSRDVTYAHPIKKCQKLNAGYQKIVTATDAGKSRATWKALSLNAAR